MQRTLSQMAADLREASEVVTPSGTTIESELLLEKWILREARFAPWTRRVRLRPPSVRGLPE